MYSVAWLRAISFDFYILHYCEFFLFMMSILILNSFYYYSRQQLQFEKFHIKCNAMDILTPLDGNLILSEVALVMSTDSNLASLNSIQASGFTELGSKLGTKSSRHVKKLRSAMDQHFETMQSTMLEVAKQISGDTQPWQSE